MATWPDYVEYAFSAIRIIGTDEEYIQAFATRWGGLELANFAQALREGTFKDQQVAAFALGYSESTWSRDLLLPLLQHEHPQVRWTVTLALGDRREDAAFPALLAMLQEFLPPHSHHSVDYDWYDVQHIHVANILGSWGNRAAILALRDTLAQMWQIEQVRTADESPQMWWPYQDAIAYALGQLGAFEALADLKLPEQRIHLWSVNMIMGYLNAQKIYKQDVWSIMLNSSLHEDTTKFLVLVSTLLQEKMGLTQQEAASFLTAYSNDYTERWETLV
jgi:hypothetical protein